MRLTRTAAAVLLLGVACSDKPGAGKQPAAVRAARRAYDGAPPVMPHAPFGMACVACHNVRGLAVDGVGFAPPSPHGELVDGALRRCQQCHVEQRTDGEFRANAFAGLAQDLRPGARMYEGAPPTIPHQLQLRDNCAACHDGPAARAEIRCSHPERVRCLQCHLPVAAESTFARAGG